MPRALVRIEDIEFGLVGDKGRACVLAIAVAGIREAIEIGRFADGKAFDHGRQHVPVVREIAQDYGSSGARKEHRRHHVVFGEVLPQVVERGVLRAELFRYAHGRKVEEEDQQAFVVKLNMAWG